VPARRRGLARAAGALAALGATGGGPPTAAAVRGLQVGKGRQSVKNELEKMKFDEITCREAVMKAAEM
jgi:hypothetical protein